MNPRRLRRGVAAAVIVGSFALLGAGATGARPVTAAGNASTGDVASAAEECGQQISLADLDLAPCVGAGGQPAGDGAPVDRGPDRQAGSGPGGICEDAQVADVLDEYGIALCGDDDEREPTGQAPAMPAPPSASPAPGASGGADTDQPEATGPIGPTGPTSAGDGEGDPGYGEQVRTRPVGAATRPVLAETGADVRGLLPPALLMLLAGTVATVAARRRRAAG